MVLKAGKERKVKNGYPWIFRDELEDIVGDPENGDVVNVFSHRHEFLGKAFYGSRLRMITRHDEDINPDFFRSRILMADEKRDFQNPYYRVVHGEADSLPGLIVDRYGDGFVVQLRNAGMERFRWEIVEVLVKDLGAKFVHERSDFESDPGERLERRNETLYGEVPEETVILENDMRFIANLKRGQKTGFFFDQRANRFKVRKLEGKRALDLFTYTGGFALNLARTGFEVVGVDISGPDLELARRNAKMNDLRVEFVESDVFDYLRGEREIFDVIVADPPAVIKRKAERKKGIEFFSRLVEESTGVLKIGGTLVLCSCAYHMDLSSVLESMRRGIEGSGKRWRIIDVTFQDLDHPWIAQMPESLYLKCVWAKLEEG